MRLQSLALAIIGISMFIISSCAGPMGKTGKGDSVGIPSREAKVIAINTRAIPRYPRAGGLVGSLLGGFGGSFIGSGIGSQAASIGGALAGNAVGSRTAQQMPPEVRVITTVKLRSGDTLSVESPSTEKNRFRVGQDVIVLQQHGEISLIPTS